MRSEAIDFTSELNAEQYRAVAEGSGSALVLAGAGSGKTRVITYRVAWLLQHGVEPSSILLLTFTNRASREMIERVEGLVGHYPSGLWSGTFHSVANRLLRKYASRVGYTANFSILDQEDARDLVSLCIKDLKIVTKNKRFPNATVVHSVISFARNKHITVTEALERMHPNFLPIAHELQAVADLYAKQKRSQNSMDFDDLLLVFLDLLEHHTDVKQQLGTLFEWILVDEFQDTNVIQARIVRHLSAVHKNLFVVGDDAQSIYSFRAADIQNILSFPEQYDEVKTFRLTQNYRSTAQILQLANDVIAQNTEQFPKELEAVVGTGEKPKVVALQSANKEAEYIAEQLMELRERGVALRDMAVLFRATFHSQALEFELMKRNIPYDYRGGLKFFERSHVKDVVAHIRVAHNVKDGMAWVRVLRIHPGIGLVTAGKIAEMAGSLGTLGAVLGMTVRGVKASAGFESAKRVLRQVADARPFASDYIRAIAGSAEYRAYLESEFPNFQERLDDLEQFAIFAEPFEDLASFLEAVSLTDEFGAGRDQEGRGLDRERVVLSTIHQAKGLEWDVVFVMHLADGSFPHKRALDDMAQLEEERRLFYVAITRARKQLWLTYPITRGYEHVEMCLPSVFLEDIPKRLIEEIEVKSSFYGSQGSHDGYGGYGGYASKAGFKRKTQGSLGKNRSDYGGSGGVTLKRVAVAEVEDDGFLSDEAVIELDDDGEVKEVKTSFLRSLDEL